MDNEIYNPLLAEAKAKVIGGIGRLSKTGRNSFHNYDFVENDAIIEIVRGLFLQQGVDLTISHASKPDVLHGDKTRWAMVHLRIVLSVGKESEVSEWYGEGQDNGDKSVRKAETSAFKSYLIKNLMITGGEKDPDGESPQAPGINREVNSSQHYDELLKARADGQLFPQKKTAYLNRWEFLYKEGKLTQEHYAKGIELLETI